jgi:hypothetical protein
MRLQRLIWHRPKGELRTYWNVIWIPSVKFELPP